MTREEVLDEINVLYERISNPEDCENGCYSFSDGNYTEALEILIDYYEVGLIEELEKIKAEIIGSCNNIAEEVSDLSYTRKIYVYEQLSEIKGAIDKHISDLKGE